MEQPDNRKKNIINLIANSNGYISGNEISLSLHVSLRTVQAEISQINKKSPLILSSNRGYSINRKLYQSSGQEILYNTANDNHMILRKLIFSNNQYQIDELAESLYMSTSTLEKKLKGIHPTLQQYHLSIERSRSYIQISGDELSKRRLIKFLIFEEINPAFNSIDNLSTYFHNMDLDKIKSIILNSIDQYHYYVDHAYYNNIIINIVIALCRMRSAYYVTDTESRSCRLETDEYQIACEICRQYSLHCRIEPSSFDIQYLSTLLEGQIRPIGNKLSVSDDPEIVSSEFMAEIDEILKLAFNYYMLNINYSEYLYSFALHVKGMIQRAHNTQPADNDLLNNIKKNCPFIHDVSVLIAQKIGEKYQIKIEDSEIGYISIHMGYLIETAAKNTNKIVVLLFCSDYHHIEETIHKKLLNHFSDLIEVKLFRAGHDDSVISIPSDIIITTKPFNMLGKKVLLISPFYTMMDHIHLDQAIHFCIREKDKSYRSSLLSSLFHENLFFKCDKFESKEEVIQFLGQKTIDFGLTKKGFIESVLERESLSSTCFFETFAIPHAIDMNAQKTMICVLLSRKGIPWDHHRIPVVLMIAVHQQDRKRFMELYNAIVQVLEETEKVNRLIAADSYMDFINQLILDTSL